MAWEYGDVVVTRDVIDGKPWVAVPQYVVDDTADLLVTYLPEGAPIGYLPDSDHPWYPQPAWQGSGALELRRPGDTYSVLHFWRGTGGEFERVVREPRSALPPHADRVRLRRRGARHHRAPGRVVVLQGLGPPRRAPWRTAATPPRTWRRIRADGLRIGAELDAGARWWSDEWVTWKPDPLWTAPELPDGWSDVPV